MSKNFLNLLATSVIVLSCGTAVNSSSCYCMEGKKSSVYEISRGEKIARKTLANFLVSKDVSCFLDDGKDILEVRTAIKTIISRQNFNNKQLKKQDVQDFVQNINNHNNLLENISALFYQIHKKDSDKSDKLDSYDSIRIWELLEYYISGNNSDRYQMIKKNLSGKHYFCRRQENLLFAITDYYLNTIINGNNVKSTAVNIDFINGNIYDNTAKQKLKLYLEQIQYENYCNTILKKKFDIMSEKLNETVKKKKYAFNEQDQLKEYEKTFEEIQTKISVNDWNTVVGKNGKLLNDIKNFVLLFNALQDNIENAKKNPIKSLHDQENAEKHPIQGLHKQLLEKLDNDTNGLIEYLMLLDRPNFNKSLNKHKNIKLKDKDDVIKLLKEIKKELDLEDKNIANNNKQSSNNNTNNNMQIPNNQQMMQGYYPPQPYNYYQQQQSMYNNQMMYNQQMMQQPMMYPSYQQPNNYNNQYNQQMMYNNQMMQGYYPPQPYNSYYNNNTYQRQQMMYNQNNLNNRQNSMQNQHRMQNNQQYGQNDNDDIITTGFGGSEKHFNQKYIRSQKDKNN